MSVSSVPQVSWASLSNRLSWILFSVRVALFYRERPATPCNCGEPLCLFICYALASVPCRSQPNRHRQHQPERHSQVSGADFVPTWALIPKAWHGTWIVWYSHAHCSCCYGGWDRRLAYQIFICLLCSVLILWTGKMHYVWMSAGVSSDKENWTVWIRKQICFVFRERHSEYLAYSNLWLWNIYYILMLWM